MSEEIPFGKQRRELSFIEIHDHDGHSLCELVDLAVHVEYRTSIANVSGTEYELLILCSFPSRESSTTYSRRSGS